MELSLIVFAEHRFEAAETFDKSIWRAGWLKQGKMFIPHQCFHWHFAALAAALEQTLKSQRCRIADTDVWWWWWWWWCPSCKACKSHKVGSMHSLQMQKEVRVPQNQMDDRYTNVYIYIPCMYVIIYIYVFVI